ncbi:MAG: hypothetical protein LH649_08320 [Pseudanabaena sp. CAN_BIN31]|nr:hypothetical protein [Pseudanabaena sp. CAN_BIN31]
MKQVFYSIVAIALSVFSISSDVQALEEGLYWSGGSRYIRIAKQASPTGDKDRDRVCYQGFSPNGSMIVSLKLVIPRYQTGIDYEVYSLQEPKKGNSVDLSIQQYAYSPDKIAFGKLVGRFVKGGLVYKRDAKSAIDTTPELQKCLKSTQPYFKQILSGRDRR